MGASMRHLSSSRHPFTGDAYRAALEEHTEVAQLLTQRNRQLKEVIDQMRSIIWEINTMLAMRQT